MLPLTGFDPFNGARVNPSWQAVQQLHGQRIADHTVFSAQLPTAFGSVLQTLDTLLLRRPRVVICVGQAGGRAAFSLERVAINVDDAPIPDNLGAQPIDQPIVPDGPAAYFSSLPLKPALAELQRAGVRAEVSQTAGTFVCNHVFYGLMHRLATRPELVATRGGFVHVPWLPEQGSPAMGLEEVVLGLRTLLKTALAAPAGCAAVATVALGPTAGVPRTSGGATH